MLYKYKGKVYRLGLNDDSGKVYCHADELGTIEADTAAEVQAKIRKAYDAAHDPKQKIKVLTFGEYWHADDTTQYFEGTITGNEDHGQYWMSYKDEDGDSRRVKTQPSHFWLDTPENRALLNQIVAHRKAIEEIRSQIDILHDQLESAIKDKE